MLYYNNNNKNNNNSFITNLLWIQRDKYTGNL